MYLALLSIRRKKYRKFISAICKDKVSYADLENLYKGLIDNGYIICTGSHKSYIQFAKVLKLDHKRIMRKE